ncbi:hypothetical protein SEEB0208_22940 [Salmonella enterica subsp. enterica serovar Bareilly str. CFSAN000208]|nr:hypothetical protein SEEB0208_22940 [Salmonella enterica subsp. enterica serovar Bareilly str. CFSAN000208]KFU05379.1 hypothetical protein SEEB0201_06795 [Salmonella enterica subsp. enterica serovar Bareilly str. CFSAN000201]
MTPVYLMTTLMPDVPTATGNLKYTAESFDTELSLIFFDKDILHFRHFAMYVAAIFESGQFLILFCQLMLQTNDLSGHLLFAFRRCPLTLLFASPVIDCDSCRLCRFFCFVCFSAHSVISFHRFFPTLSVHQLFPDEHLGLFAVLPELIHHAKT